MASSSPPAPLRRIGRSIEVYRSHLASGPIRHALFDFDGTLSLIRAGWQEVMVSHCYSELSRTPAAESRQELEQVCREFITRLTGAQTIYQMLELEKQVARRGGGPLPASTYKRQYLDRLQRRIRHRLAALEEGRRPAAAYLVRNSLSLLRGLAQRGATCHLASGTDHHHVVAEAGLLGLIPFFGERIHGAREDLRASSKRKVIEDILGSNGGQGGALAVFGDGYVEISAAVEAGGLAIGIASREGGGAGMDPWKKKRLLEVGAHLLVPDWQEADLLLAYIFGEVDAPGGRHLPTAGKAAPHGL